MDTKKKLVFATNNSNKLREARQILADSFEIVSLQELGCHDDIDETADTLAGNALIKARYVKERYGCDCFADDTGLMVDALDGAPGVYSARYAGEHCTPADNVAKLLRVMKDEDNRNAHFSTVIALIHDGKEFLFEGRVDGSIACEESGEGGFGYDPVFIADESGRSFASMTPEEKNAISHRGRAMSKLAGYLKTLVVIIIAMCGFASSLRAQEWRLMPSYDGQMENMVVTPDYVYFLGAAQAFARGNATMGNLYGNLFKYDIANGEMTYLNSSNELSGNIVKAIAYNYDKRYLAVALSDGTVNLLYDNGQSKIIAGLSIADPSLDKIINDITFDSAANEIYLATNFGYVIIDDILAEIKTSRILNIEVVSCVKFKSKMWLANANGIFAGNPNSFSAADFVKQANVRNVTKLNVLGNETLFVSSGTKSAYSCGVLKNADATPVYEQLSRTGLYSAFVSKDYYVTTSSAGIDVYNSKLTRISYPMPADYTKSEAASYNGRQFWFSSGREGISCLDAPVKEGDNWTVKINRFLPDASNVFMSMSMAYHPDYGVLVRNHGYEHPFASSMTNCYDLISGYRNMSWTPLSTTYRVKNGLYIDNPWGAAIDPDNSDHVYCGSERSGLFRLDLKEPEKSMQFSKATDLYGNHTKPGYVAVLPDNPAGTWGEQCVFSPPMFDSYGNLWAAYVDPDIQPDGIKTSTKTTLIVWNKDARRSTVSASTFKPWDKIEIPEVISLNTPKLLALKHQKVKDLVLVYGNTKTTPLVILDHGGTPANTNDDRIARMKNIYDQDGEALDFVYIYDWYEDPLTGLVWVAYNDGVFTFDPVEAFQNPTSVRRIKVPRNDGTNLADYLLNKVTINSISVDGQNRKWFGTQGAGLVCTSADGRTIYHSYTPDNSPLPGSSVYAVQYNPASNSMVISTDGGLCELFLSGSSETSSKSDVRCYPNPVRPDYFGVVTIDGLQEDAMVKIVDTAGNLVKECGSAPLGSVMWDLTNSFMKRVPGGVYYVVVSGGISSDSYSKVGKILVVD